MQKIKPFLWFDTQAEEAATFYVSIFSDSKILSRTFYGDAGPMPKGMVMTVEFQLEGQRFVALNGGPHFTFTPAISLYVSCETQEEVDGLWDALTSGGEPGRCAWLKDKYGVSWQIVPIRLIQLLNDKNPQKANRVVEAMLKMNKIEVAELERAYNDEGDGRMG